MNIDLELLVVILVVSAILSILYSVLDKEKVKRLNLWFHILVGKRENYDFEATIKRTRFVFYYFTFISALGIALSFVNESLGAVFVWIVFISLVIAIYYLYPVKRSKKDQNEK
ncbi:hypothetical protein [Amphibacillus cookii]|uniref:hypothetical protein n=1 Tax=Amphibacillus cookii TaxID=767787 RepID=UPI001956BD70|nr:hypothetical protein [Amphibacillus cookii]MBM7541706.1 4-hydroxybenzoate polyprenyltransferase [Amphibacillus cookii]